MIPAPLIEAIDAAATAERKVADDVRTFPEWRKKTRQAWETFVTAVRDNDDPAAAYRAYRATADKTAKRGDRIRWRQSVTHDAYTKAVVAALEHIKAQLHRAQAKGGHGYAVDGPDYSDTERDKMMREAYDDYNALADHIGAPASARRRYEPTPNGTQSINSAHLLDHHRTPQLLQVDIRVVENYTGALDHAQAHLIAREGDEKRAAEAA